MNGEKFNLELELEKLKTIVYTSCVAVFTIVASVCLIMFARSSSRLMNRCGTKAEKIESNLLDASGNLAKLMGNLASEEAPKEGTNGYYLNKTLKGSAKFMGDLASDEPSKPGSNGDNLGKILKNAAEISQVAKEKLVGDEGNKGLLENAYEVSERANNCLKSVNESHVITAKLDTRTDKEKSDEEAQRKKKTKEEFEQMSDSANANDILSMPDSLPKDDVLHSNGGEQEASAESTQTCNIM